MHNMEIKPSFCPASSFSQSWKSYTGQLLRAVCTAQSGTVRPPYSVLVTFPHPRCRATSPGKLKFSTGGRKPHEKISGRQKGVKMIEMQCSQEARLYSNLQGPGTLLPWQRDISWLLSFNWALLPAVRTNNGFNTSVAAPCNTPCSPCQSTSHTLFTASWRIHSIWPGWSQTGAVPSLPAALPLAQ